MRLLLHLGAIVGCVDGALDSVCKFYRPPQVRVIILPMNLRIKRAAHTIKSGGIIAYPTEGVWGLGCDPYDRLAVLRILALKQRPLSKGLILVAGSTEQALPFLQLLTEAQRQAVLATWPGPNTWIVPVTASVPDWITGDHSSVAIRVTDHPQLQALCLAVGQVIVSTSANRAGRPPAKDRVRVQSVFGQDLDYVLAGATSGRSQPSHIRHAVSGTVIR